MEAHCREKTERPENEIEYIIFYNIIVDERVNLPDRFFPQEALEFVFET